MAGDVASGSPGDVASGSSGDVASGSSGDVASGSSGDVVTVTDDELRQALELALGVAKGGARQKPPLAVSGEIRALFPARRIDAAGLSTVRTELDVNDELRRRVGAVATPALSGGQLAFIWLTRPEDWQKRIVDLRLDAMTPDKPNTESHGKDRKRLDAATAAARDLRLEVERLRESAKGERDRRRALEQIVADTRSELDRATQRLGEHERSVVRATERVGVAHEKVKELSASLDVANAAVQSLTERLDAALADRAAAMFSPTSPVAEPGAAAMRQLLDRVRDLGADAARVLAAAQSSVASPPRPASPSVVRSGAHPGEPRPAKRRKSTRTPIAMPGGVFADSNEAKEYLLRFPGAAVIVDGYNVAKLGWPALALDRQREALLDAVDTMVRRIGTRVIVVFDGAALVAPASGRRLMSVIFTTDGWSADDEIRRLADALPDSTALVVVTDDRQIQADVRPLGANTMRSGDLLVAIRR